MEKISPHFVEKPWAGQFIHDRFAVTPLEEVPAHADLASVSALKPASARRPIGEAWLLSTLPNRESRVGKQNLSTYLNNPLSFIVKIIDAKENLLVQVHPDDAWAEKLENSKGKAECWLILNAEEDAGVYLGLRTGVDAAQFQSALETGTGVEDLLNFFPVRRGDFVSVPTGTIHAIGGGVTLLEVQQVSGVTYRLWDWGRANRDLHLEKALKVMDYNSCFEIRFGLLDLGQSGTMMKHADFECFVNESHGAGWFIDLQTFDVYHSDQSRSAQFVFVK